MTYEDAAAAAKQAFYDAQPNLGGVCRDFQVAVDVFDAIERESHERQGLVMKLPDDPKVGRSDHMIWHGVRMYRGER